jgi:hypothetical protein
VRCAFCHDALDEKEEENVRCPSCSTVLHWDCRALLARCPTLGCANVSTFLRAGRTAVVRPAFREALARLATRERPPEEEQRERRRPPNPLNNLGDVIAELATGSPGEDSPVPLPVVSSSLHVICGICRWQIDNVELDSWRCERCGTYAHRECRTWYAGACPRSGCSAVYFGPPTEGEGRKKETFRRALDSLKQRKPRPSE